MRTPRHIVRTTMRRVFRKYYRRMRHERDQNDQKVLTELKQTIHSVVETTAYFVVPTWVVDDIIEEPKDDEILIPPKWIKDIVESDSNVENVDEQISR